MSQAQGPVRDDKPSILVAGDICLDVVRIPVARTATGGGESDNWRLSGEMDTHYLPGGAFLLSEFVRACAPDFDVKNPVPCRPKELTCDGKPEQPMSLEVFLGVAERLTRDEIVHSVMQLGLFKAGPDSKKADTVRVKETHGFSGPKKGDPNMSILPPQDGGKPCAVVVLDDTGNRFRRSPDQWPALIQNPPKSDTPIIVYKLHRSLPCPKTSNALWDVATRNYRDRCIVIVAVEDLREKDAPISRGLSWERTALDLVWQLTHADGFEALRKCQHLIVRFGLDGALYWHGSASADTEDGEAWLIYDPAGIEGTGSSACSGQMVGYASVFAAALVRHLAVAIDGSCMSMVTDEDGEAAPPAAIENGIKEGLIASRRLLAMGYGKDEHNPKYPCADLFMPKLPTTPFFACHRVPMIPGAASPDRAYWRLLESIFLNKPHLLRRAVTLTATGAKPVDKDDKDAAALLQQVPVAVFAKALRAIDRCEIENYRALYSLMRDYLRVSSPPRPLSVAVFGPPGAGKSFGVKMVAKALGELREGKPIKSITFNLSQYEKADDLAEAFHLVRDCVLEGMIPLVFFDEFDTSLEGKALGWLRYFLAPMQDGQFLDHGTPHPIGPAIFVFAGGTCGSYAEFARPFTDDHAGLDVRQAFQKAKGPDFLSRLRATLDIPGLDLQTECDPFGPISAFPSEPAILLRRANIFAFQLAEKAPHLRDASGALNVSDSVLRALLYLPKFVHGNRSFEAMLDMSHFQGDVKFTPALLPAAGHTSLHADASHLGRLLSTEYPFPEEVRESIAKEVHRQYQEQRSREPKHNPDELALKDWDDLSESELGRSLQRSNLEQADHIAAKLLAAGLWFRKIMPGAPADPTVGKRLDTMIEALARSEHNRWVIEKRKAGWIAAADIQRSSRNDRYMLHNALFPWEMLSEDLKELDLSPVRNISTLLSIAGYEIYQPNP